ncbi:MAG TPA: hypothetical protein VKW09_12060 [bacterium]|nr:hypothetical protein [bacterium]
MGTVALVGDVMMFGDLSAEFDTALEIEGDRARLALESRRLR